ncbi:hypothetical protein HAV15_000964 [Penicillium sp. str. |nr:hypothetical protein HAV15_000964 [Penicillium sp. str. \
MATKYGQSSRTHRDFSNCNVRLSHKRLPALVRLRSKMDLSQYCQNNLLYTQESLSKYQPGGYHPVNLGDTFDNDRYKIHHKLGWGGFSTVWLAKDRDRNQWVSLKIMTANSLISRELQNLKILERQSRGGLSSNYIVQLLDAFTHKGPNGAHQCLVFELLGPSVNKVLSDYHEAHDKLYPRKPCSEFLHSF